MKKKIILIILAVLVLLSGFIYWLLRPQFQNKPKKGFPEASQTSKKSIPVNTLPLEQRPYIVLEPKSTVEPQSLGHWVTMTIDRVGEFEKVEYEFEYTTGTMIQGGMGRLDFSQERPPVAKEIAFGSASKGKYKYDEGINKGQFTFHFSKGSEESALKTDFRLETKAVNGGIFRTADDKARLETGKTDLKDNDYLIVASTLGLPQTIQGKIVVGPYGFYADSARKLTSSKIIFSKINQDNSVILFWNGQTWDELETEVVDDEASAYVKNLGTFLLVTK